MLLTLSILMIDKIWLKPIAVLLIVWWNRKENIKLTLRSIPPFYFAIISLSVLQLICIGHDSPNYILFWAIGVCYWLMCIVFFWGFAGFINRNSTQKTEYTLSVFFITNSLITLFQLIRVMTISESINPYAIWDNPDFGNSTGDYLKGLFLAPCYINFFANSFFAVFFLYKKKITLSFIAVIILCLTACNFAIIFFLPVFLINCISQKNLKPKLMALACLGFVITFYTIISVHNMHYLAESIFKVEHHYDPEQINDTSGEINKVDQTINNNIPLKEEHINFFKKEKGKIISFKQTFQFVNSSPSHLLLGAGMGNFSSLLAQRQSDIQIKKKSRLFQKLPIRIATDYKNNHYNIEYHLYSLPGDWHSIQHLPSSFFNQILGEYGLLGCLSFILLYVVFILKKVKANCYILPMSLLAGYYLIFDYLFEYLSIMILFEIFFLLYLKEKNNTSIEPKTNG